MRWPHIIFAPNPTGAVTVANAVVFWANVRAAAENGYVLLVRIDDQLSDRRYPGVAQSDMAANTMQHFLNSFQELRGYLGSHEYTNRYGLPMVFRGHDLPHYWRVLESAIVRGAVGAVEGVGGGCYRLPKGDLVMATVMQDYAFSPAFMNACDAYEYNTPLVIRGGNLRCLEKPERAMLDALQLVFGYRVEPEYRYTPRFYMYPYPLHYGWDNRAGFVVGGDPTMRKSTTLPMTQFREWVRRFNDPEKNKEEIRAALDEIAKMGDAVIYHEDGSIEPLKEEPK